MQSIAELKAEISTLKALLVTKSESSSTNSTAATSASTSESASPSSVAASSAAATSSATAPPPVPVKPKETRRERMLNALKKLRTQVWEIAMRKNLTTCAQIVTICMDIVNRWMSRIPASSSSSLLASWACMSRTSSR